MAAAATSSDFVPALVETARDLEEKEKSDQLTVFRGNVRKALDTWLSFDTILNRLINQGIVPKSARLADINDAVILLQNQVEAADNARSGAFVQLIHLCAFGCLSPPLFNDFAELATDLRSLFPEIRLIAVPTCNRNDLKEMTTTTTSLDGVHVPIPVEMIKRHTARSITDQRAVMRGIKLAPSDPPPYAVNFVVASLNSILEFVSDSMTQFGYPSGPEGDALNLANLALAGIDGAAAD